MGGDDARRVRFPNFIGCRVSVMPPIADDVEVGGSIMTSFPSLMIVLDRFFRVVVESTKSP
jgi:hypothetical protein